jgi:hypothetical protein
MREEVAINGINVALDAGQPTRRLLDILREDLQLTAQNMVAELVVVAPARCCLTARRFNLVWFSQLNSRVGTSRRSREPQRQAPRGRPWRPRVASSAVTAHLGLS